MRSNALFQQCTWLVNLLKRYQKLSLDQINKHWRNHHLSEGQDLSRSTFNRHREAIQDMFGIIIECDIKGGYAYYISNPEILEDDSIQNWMFSTLSVNGMLSASKSVHHRILLEKIPSDGDNLHTFIDAMQRGKRVQVAYKKYGTEEEKIRVLEPYFVKLFQKRWYALVKHVEPDAPLFTLSFDRITNLEIIDETYVYNEEIDPAAWFKQCYGIVRDVTVPVQRVVIRAYSGEVHYLRDLPLHPSQKEIEETTAYSDFELMLSPTPDFYTPLVSRGPAIKILEPQWLADEIKQLHQDALQLYTL